MRKLIATIATALLCGVLLSGCGSDTPSVDIDALKDAAKSQPDAEQDSDDQEDPASKKLKPIEFLLPETPDAPSGFRAIPAECETGSSETEYRSWYGLAVPEDWESGGIIGGSSAPLDEGTTLKFGTGSDRASVEAESESRLPDGSISDTNGEKWTTFDYDHSSYGDDGETSGTVKFEEFATVSIDGQDVTIMAAPHQQDTEFLEVTEYKARINAANLYSRFQDADRPYTSSFIVTITPTKDDKELDEEVVSGIVGSFTMPECARELVIVSEEVNVRKDVDGDGKVATIDDLRELMNRK